MHGTLLRSLFAAGALIGATATGVQALPDRNEPIDPTKRAPISTADAVRPAATPPTGDGAIGTRVIRPSEVPVRRATLGDQRAPIEMRETRDKKVSKPEARTLATREFDSRPAGAQRAAIPRLDQRQYQEIITAYEEGRVPADALAHAGIDVGGQRVSLAEINRYANPRAALEAQGIPVTPAASGEAATRQSAPVPVPAEKNAGAPARR